MRALILNSTEEAKKLFLPYVVFCLTNTDEMVASAFYHLMLELNNVTTFLKT